MPKRPTISDEFRHRALSYGKGCWWPQRWANDEGDPPTYDEVLAHLIRLKEMKLEVAHLVKQGEFYEEGDEKAPFYSEACLYNVLGKDDARTILATLHTTIEMLEALLGKRFPLEIIY